MNSAKRQTRSQLWVLHWMMAISFAILFAVGLYMVDLPREVGYRPSLYSFHKSLGVLVMLLLSVRIFLALRAITPAQTKNRVAMGLHASLYVLMLVVPLSGYLYSNLRGRDVALFGLPLPAIASEDKALGDAAKDTHGWLAYTLVAFAGAHLLAQCKQVASSWKRFNARRSSAT